jgi:glycosyltransferase involved in cell wall biosynthesis
MTETSVLRNEPTQRSSAMSPRRGANADDPAMPWDPIHRAWAIRELERLAPWLPDAATFGLARLRERAGEADFGTIDDRQSLAELRATAAAAIRADDSQWPRTPIASRLKRRMHRAVEGTWLERSIRTRRRQPPASEVARPAVRGEAPTVLHAIHALTSGGAQQLVVDLVSDPESGLRHRIVAARVPFPRHYPGLQSTVLDHPTVPEFRALLRRSRAKVLHLAHYHHPTEVRVAAWYDAVGRAACLEGVPILQSNMTPGDPWIDPADPFGRKGPARSIVCCSDWSLRNSGLAGMDGAVIHPGTPLAWFDARAEPRRSPSGSRDGFRMGFAARLDGDKFGDSIATILIQAAALEPSLSFAIAGDGGLRAGLEDRLRRAGIADRVEFRGRIAFEDLPAFYASLDVAIAPMAADTFGSGSVHAIASGTPVAGFAAAALPEILVHPSAMAPAGDARALAERAVSILRDQALRDEVWTAQRRNAERRFDLAVMRREYAARLRSLASSGNRSTAP